MKALKRVNESPESMYLHDNCIRGFRIGSDRSIVSIFESYPYNNEYRFSEEEKAELNINNDSSVILKERFERIKILSVVYSSNYEMTNGTVLMNRLLPNNIMEFDFLCNNIDDYAYISFSFENFHWDMIKAVNLNDVDDFVSKNIDDLLVNPVR